MKEKKNIIQYLTIGIFLLFIFSLAIVNIFCTKVDYSENENRSLASFPSVTLENLFSGTFDDDFEDWFSDHFVARDSWIQVKARTKQLTGSIENNSVYFGKEDRLIQQFTSYDSKTLENNIQYINDFCDANNVTANILLAPGASYGEKEFLPFGSYNLDEKSLIYSIGKSFQDQNYIDITDEISEENDLYYNTDHHWNEKGAYIGYSAICENVLDKEPNTFTYEKVADGFKGTMYSKSGAFWNTGDAIYKMIPDKEYTVSVSYDDGTESNSLFVDENLDKKDKYTYYLDGNHAYVDIKTNVKTKKKAVIVKDSYSHILIPYLTSEYSEIQVVDLRYYRQSVSSMIDKDTDFYVIYSLESFVSDNNLAVLW